MARLSTAPVRSFGLREDTRPGMLTGLQEVLIALPIAI